MTIGTQGETEARQALCDKVRELIGRNSLDRCEEMILDAMGRYPHAPEPHNLLGVLLEKQGDHLLAMKHFRAAWALDPTYRPVRRNLDNYASFCAYGAAAYDESDCEDEPSLSKVDIVYDPRGIGHVVRRC